MFGQSDVDVDDPDLAAGERLLVACADAADSALAAAARVEVTGLDDDVVAAVVLRLERARRLLDATESHGLSHLDATGHSDRAEGLATSRWLARDAGLPAHVARRRLTVANRLAELPGAVDAAHSSGRLGCDHVGVLADSLNDRNVEEFAHHLDGVISGAGCSVFGSWRRCTRSLAGRLDPDGSADRPADELADKVQLSPSDRFMWLRGELTGEGAVTVRQTLETVADELFRQWSHDCAAHPELTVPGRGELLAQALVEVCRRARSVELGSSRPPRPEVTLVAHDDRPGMWFDAWGDAHPGAALRCLLCDPTMRSVLLDPSGVPLDVGRAVRHPTPSQRRALAVRDGGCVFPGCGAPVAWTDSHHVEHWDPDGPTDLCNLVLVCRRHHGVAHRRGWQVRLTDEGWTIWTTPLGRRRWGQRHHVGRDGPAP